MRKAAGPDGIPPRVARLCFTQLSPVLTDLFNLSLERRIVPRSFKESIIIPVPKKSPVTCLNDYRPIALTSVLMKCLERLVFDYIKREISVSSDPLQFAYRKNRSVEDAISVALNFVYEHLDTGNANVRMLFIDYSSAFNTIIPSNLVHKLRCLGLCEAVCEWIFNFLICSPQKVRIGDRLSDECVLSTGSPQGCILSPLLFSLCTYDCTASYNNNLILKSADDTTVIGKINCNDESLYRAEVQNLVKWSEKNSLILNASKTKEIIIDFCRKKRSHLPLIINNTEVEMVSSFKFLGVTITNNLRWHLNTSTIVKKSMQRLFFLRKLKDFTSNCQILINFYRCIIESILTSSSTV